MNAEFLTYHLVLAGIFVLLTQSLLWIFRADLFSLGHHGFFGFGAYTAAATLRLVLGPSLEWPLATPGDRVEGLFLLLGTVLAGALVTGLLGNLIARLLAGLRADSFAVATLILAEVLQSLAANAGFVGGALGFETPYLFVRNAGAERPAYLAFFAAAVIGANAALYLAFRRFERSLAGLYVTAGSDDEMAAEASGLNVGGLKRAAFTLGSAVAGGTGALFLHFTTVITPTDFGFANGLPIVLYVVLGGLQLGPSVTAALCLYSLYELIKLRFLGALGESAGEEIARWQQALLALVLIAAASLPSLKKIFSKIVAGRPEEERA